MCIRFCISHERRTCRALATISVFTYGSAYVFAYADHKRTNMFVDLVEDTLSVPTFACTNNQLAHLLRFDIRKTSIARYRGEWWFTFTGVVHVTKHVNHKLFDSFRRHEGTAVVEKDEYEAFFFTLLKCYFSMCSGAHNIGYPCAMKRKLADQSTR